MTFNCNTCDFLLEWPENWVKGNRPIESELKKEHTRERCEEIEKRNQQKKTPGWIKRICELCSMETWFSKKHYNERTAVCGECYDN